MHSDTTMAEEPAAARGAVAIITNRRGELLLHLRDDLPHIAWPAHWSLLGGGCDPGESPAAAIVRELDEEVGQTVQNLAELCEIRDEHGSGQIISFHSATWNGDESTLPLSEGDRSRRTASAAASSSALPG
ncbi:NUDIX domain-containing protein [Streptomyces sp. NPDC101150]|uniref:NUDIX domain-containing protein n=1 Tax=Streptomyces sp. NPDC101150 TaxID=3366114 RepID=UPI003806C4C7